MTTSPETLSSATVDETAASTPAPALRRYAHPPLVNPIEPGVAADPKRPGTGVDTVPLRPSDYEERRDPAIYDIDEQDVLITADGGHPPTGHTAGWVLYGRHIVMIGIERTAGSSIGAPKISYHMGPRGRRHIEGCVFDASLGGADDMHSSLQGPYLWNSSTLVDFSKFHAATRIITLSWRLYQLTTPGTFQGSEPDHETPGEVRYGSAGLTFLKKYADENAYRADWLRQPHTFQNIYSRGRHGSYAAFDAGPMSGDGQTYVRVSTPIIKITREANGIVTLTAPGHGLVAGTHTRINVCFAPYETLADGTVVRGVGGVWVPTSIGVPGQPNADEIKYQSDILNSPLPPPTPPGIPVPFEAPANEPFVLQSFTKAASCSVRVQNGVATITTEAPHNSPGVANGLKNVRLFGRSLPAGFAGNDMPVTAAEGTSITATATGLKGGVSLPDAAIYADLVVTMHGNFQRKGPTGRQNLSSHADFDQCDVNSRIGTVRYYRCTDTHHSYDHSIGGLRFKAETGLSGLDYEYVNIRRRQEIIPHDQSNFTLYCNESDQSAKGLMERDDPANQLPRRLTEVNFRNEVSIELDRNESGIGVVHPPSGSTCNGVPTGAIDQTVAGQRFLTWPTEGKMFGRCNLDPCQGGDTTARDIVKRSEVGSGYVWNRLTTAVAPPAPTVEPPPPSFSENTPRGKQLGWIRCDHGQEDQIVDVTLGDTLGGRFQIRGARLLRGPKAMTYAGTVDLGGGQRGYRVPLIATMRSNPGLTTTGCVDIPITREADPLPVSSETWNPTGLAAGLALSNANLTVSVAADQGGGNRTLKATRAITAGRVYFEVTTLGVTVSANGRPMIGLAPATLGSATALSQLGAGGVSLRVDGKLHINGAEIPNVSGLAFPVIGSVVRMCVDRGANKLYLAVNDGAWANGADPIAGTGGYDLPPGGANLFPAVTLRGGGDSFEAAFDGEAMRYEIPAGYAVLSETWNPTGLAAGLVLSNANLTVSVAPVQSAVTRTIKATKAITGSKVYFEVMALGVTPSANGRSGIGLAPAALGTGTAPGQAGAGGVSLLNNGRLYVNGAIPKSNGVNVPEMTGVAFLRAGSVVRVCADLVANRFYLAVNGGAWANGADPVAGTGGYDLPSGSTTLFPAVSTQGVGDRFAAAFDPGALSYPIPAGYAAL